MYTPEVIRSTVLYTSSVMNVRIFSILDQKGKFSIPVLDVKSKQLVVKANQTLALNCR